MRTPLSEYAIHSRVKVSVVMEIISWLPLTEALVTLPKGLVPWHAMPPRLIESAFLKLHEDTSAWRREQKTGSLLTRNNRLKLGPLR